MTNSPKTYFRTGDTVRVINLDGITEKRTRNLIFVGSEGYVTGVWMNHGGDEIVTLKLTPELPSFAMYEWNLNLAG